MERDYQRPHGKRRPDRSYALVLREMPATNNEVAGKACAPTNKSLFPYTQTTRPGERQSTEIAPLCSTYVADLL